MSSDQIEIILLAIFVFAIELKLVCETMCAPPREKKEKLNVHIFHATSPFEKFCASKNRIDVSEKDIGTITKEGYYPCCVLALITISAVCFLAFDVTSTSLVVAYSVLLIQGLTVACKKPILKLSKRILTKCNII